MARKKRLASLTAKQLNQLINVALGKEKADTAVINARLVNVYTGEVLPGYSVAVKGQRIAYVGPRPEPCIGPQTHVIDAGGKVLIPGMVESHTHLVFYYGPIEFLRYIMLSGTTTLITEVQELPFAFGYRGFLEYLNCLHDQPIKIMVTLPPMVTLSPVTEARAIQPQEARQAFRKPEVVGLGESYWFSVVQGTPRLRGLFRETLRAGKRLEGHAAGAREEKLVAYAAAGVTSCHEPITPEEILERLRLGIYVMLRQGSIRRDLEALKPLLDKGVDLHRVTLATDGVDPHVLLHGYLDTIAQQAIDLGVSPVQAIQMITLNPAEHFGLDNLVGGLAPHRYADMVLIPELDKIQAEWVMSNGRLIAQDRKPLVDPRLYIFPEWTKHCFSLPQKLTAEDFNIRVEMAEGQVTVRVIDFVTPLVTREAQVEMAVRDGHIPMDIERDILKAAVLDLRHGTGQKAVAFVRGLKLKKGAMASSYVWDTSNVVVVGASEADMVLALKRLVELQGGAVIALDGQIACELPMPVSGFFSEQPAQVVARQAEEFQAKAASLGCPFPDALLSFTTLPTPAIPHIRLVEVGLVNVRDNQVLDLIVRPN